MADNMADTTLQVIYSGVCQAAYCYIIIWNAIVIMDEAGPPFADCIPKSSEIIISPSCRVSVTPYWSEICLDGLAMPLAWDASCFFLSPKF